MRRPSRHASIDPLEPRRLLSITLKSSTGTLGVEGTSGPDIITLEPHSRLLNMMSVRVNDQVRLIAYGAVKQIMVSGGAGNDTITLDDGIDVMPDGYEIHIRGNKGHDRIVAGEFKPPLVTGIDSYGDTYTFRAYLAIEGNDGNDHIEVNGQANIRGGNGNDLIRAGSAVPWVRPLTEFERLLAIANGTLPPESSSGGYSPNWYGGVGSTENVDVLGADRGSAVIDGGSGNDTLIGGSRVDWLAGGPGSDRLYGGDGSDSIEGGEGDDVLYPIGEDLTRTDWTGTDTGIGGSGTDWFYPDTSRWGETDYHAAQDYRFGSPDPSYNGLNGSVYFSGLFALAQNYGAIGSNYYGYSATKYIVSLVSLGDTGYAVTRQQLVDQYDEQLTGARELGEVAYDWSVGMTKRQRNALRQLTEPAGLTSAERRKIRPGLLRLGAEMSLGEAIPARDGLTWYRVNHTPAQGESDLHVVAVVLKQGSVIVAGDASVDGTIESTTLYNNSKFTREFDVIASSGTISYSRVGISPWSQIEVVGSGARYQAAHDMPEGIRIRGGADRQGILAHGGVIWLPKDNQSAYFTRLWR
jgi:Ca2+-binding RTX toxin-like protein